jgi:hypothetical protein
MPFSIAYVTIRDALHMHSPPSRSAGEVVALTIAEFIPRQVMHLQHILAGFPLLGPRP